MADPHIGMYRVAVKVSGTIHSLFVSCALSSRSDPRTNMELVHEK